MIDLKELKRIAEKALSPKKHYNANMESRSFNSKNEYAVIKENLKDRYDFEEAANPPTILQLIKEHQEMREALEFYANGGNPNRDIWFDEKLGYFTGKRARQTLEGVSK